MSGRPTLRTPDGMKQLQPWCQPHWDQLRQAVEARGMMLLVGDAKRVTEQARREIEGTANDAEGFDPLLRAWTQINTRAMVCGADLWSCPLCEVQRAHDHAMEDSPQVWIDGCTDALLGYARELHLVPPPS